MSSLTKECLGEKASFDPINVKMAKDKEDENIFAAPEVESVENSERASEKFGGVAGVLAGVMKVREEPDNKETSTDIYLLVQLTLWLVRSWQRFFQVC